MAARMVNQTGQTNVSGRPALGRTRTDPIPVAQSRRGLDVRVLTSFLPGQMVPVCAIPLLREDRLQGRLRLNFEQMETAELLVNAVSVRCLAYLVPNLAFDRFNGIDQLNRSYSKVAETEGGTVTPYFKTRVMEAHGVNKILTTMGKHARPGQTINDAYVEAYNTIWNFRVRNRSPDIALRALTDTTLAKAFWNHQGFAHIVPDFDQAVLDGEVPLNVVEANLAVKGIGPVGTATTPGTVILRETGGALSGSLPGWIGVATPTVAGTGQTQIGIRQGAVAGFPAIYAEMLENGITVSLSNIELARKTQAFAALRKQYGGHTDEYIIDLLMQGISVPEQAWRQPILLADKSTVFGMAKRYSTDSLDLTASVVNGATFIDLALHTPTVPTGGVVMVVVEVTPEQLFERQQDPYLHTTDQDLLPEFLRDTLDPEKVEVVENQYVDVDHATPTATFGYAPLNHKWQHNGPAIGGKFYRPTVDGAFDEDRQRIWAVETANPTLSEDFYLCSAMHTKPFVVTDQDTYEVVARGLMQVTGNTVFGNLLIEATDDYETVMGEAPFDRIVKPAALEASEEEAAQ